MEFSDSKTKLNLDAALSGESRAYFKYSFYSSLAKKEGFEKIAEIFCRLASNEREHAKIWFKFLNGGKSGETLENLKDSSVGEKYEWSEMYRDFAETAKEEGFDDIAKKFEQVGEIEKDHEKVYNEFIKLLEEGKVFKCDDGNCVWRCRNCGHIHIGREAPKVCPVCSHERAFFERG